MLCVFCSLFFFFTSGQTAAWDQNEPTQQPAPAPRRCLLPPHTHAQRGGREPVAGPGRQLEQRPRENSSRSVWQGETAAQLWPGRARRPSPAQTFQKQTRIQLSISPGRAPPSRRKVTPAAQVPFFGNPWFVVSFFLIRFPSPGSRQP